MKKLAAVLLAALAFVPAAFAGGGESYNLDPGSGGYVWVNTWIPCWNSGTNSIGILYDVYIYGTNIKVATYCL